MTLRAAFPYFVAAISLLNKQTALSQDKDEARVTNIFHDVQVLPAEATPRPAVIDDKVTSGTGVRTGQDSRSELTFGDLSITRLGENSIFSFNRATHQVQLDAGSVLLYVPKNSGGAQINTKAVTVGVTGTTLIFELRRDDQNRLIVLEGSARFSLNKYPKESAQVRAGYMLTAKSVARKLSRPVKIDLRKLMEAHPLIANFPPLPSLGAILGTNSGATPGPAGPATGNPPVGQTGPPPGGNNPPVATGTAGVNQVGPILPPANPTPTPRSFPTPGVTITPPKPTPTPRVRPSRRPIKPIPTATPRVRPSVRPIQPTPTPSPNPIYRRRPSPTPTPGQIIR